jgi:PfaD family protein
MGAGAGTAWLGTLPALFPEWLGDRSFTTAHGLRFPYVGGEMARGVATTEMVAALARIGALGFFGAAGLSFRAVEKAVHELKALDDAGSAWGVNLIHSPNEPELELAVAELLMRERVARVSASAYLSMSATLVRYVASGLFVDAAGVIHRRHHLFAKVSRPEVAGPFMAPPPADVLRALVTAGQLDERQAALAARVPVAEDITVEADSGGHTDNQALTALLPSMLRLRDDLAERHGHGRHVRIGAAGGLGTPGAVAAAFAMGASYVLTGSVNQSAREAGLSTIGKKLLAEAEPHDVIMAPAADMFEMGVKLQVLRRGSMFAMRAARLYEAYRAHGSLDDVPPALRAELERTVLGETFDEAWRQTAAFWRERSPKELARAETDPKHRLALTFRRYLGLASQWAIEGREERRLDFQIWCGPAMGAFNRWAAGSFLEAPEHRTVAQIALNLLEGAAVVTRASQLRTYGVPMPPSAFDYRPRPLG